MERVTFCNTGSEAVMTALLTALESEMYRALYTRPAFAGSAPGGPLAQREESDPCRDERHRCPEQPVDRCPGFARAHRLKRQDVRLCRLDGGQDQPASGRPLAVFFDVAI